MAASLFKWLIPFHLFLVHPLYVTVTQIDHNPKDKTLEISCKMFTNDLEAVLEKKTRGKVDLSDAKEKKNTDKLVADYVQQHLRLKVDGRAVAMTFVGSEQEEDGTWCYFQVNGVAVLKTLDVNNSLLYDGFDQEIQIMHVSAGGDKKSTRLNYPDTTAAFQF